MDVQNIDIKMIQRVIQKLETVRQTNRDKINYFNGNGSWI